MITVIFGACLLNASRCELIEQRVPDMSHMFCMMRGGQLVAAQWISEHPGYVIRGRIQCVDGTNA
jgi:hypothetical protein